LILSFADYPKKLTVALPPEIREINAIAFAGIVVTTDAQTGVNGLAPLDGSRVTARRTASCLGMREVCHRSRLDNARCQA
jgi:ornithine cyclodeaminase/alanine dehydrogenase-like protein (mu-crystallin family)